MATVLGMFLLPGVINEILHPSGSFAAPINKTVAKVYAWATAISASLEALCLGGLLSHRWMRKSLGFPALGICVVTSLIAIGCIAVLR